MATVSRISELKSKLVGWRTNQKSTHETELLSSDSDEDRLTLVGRYEEDYDLSVLLQNLVIPRLIAGRVAHNNAPYAAQMPVRGSIKAAAYVESLANGAVLNGDTINESDVDLFANISLTGEAHSLFEIIEVYLAEGMPVETIYVQLLAPAARKLGVYWEEDSLDFVAVTMGLWRIQEVLRELTVRVPPKSRQTYGQRSALFAPMPGEQHSLGTLMVAECFQRAGWETEVLIEPTPAEFTAQLAKSHFDLIGLTVSCDQSIAALATLVKTIKTISCNPKIRIMLGGRAINSCPEVVVECGADGTAVDAVQAVMFAESLVPHKMDTFESLI